jgi:hypothetical protein
MVRGSASGQEADSAAIANYVKSKTTLGSIVVIPRWTPNKSAGSTVSVKVKYNAPRRGPFLGAHIDSSTSIMVIAY